MASTAEATTSLALTCRPEPLKPTTSLRTVVDGPATGGPCLALSTSNVSHGFIQFDSGDTYYLFLEDNDDGAECYGLSAASMVSWIKDFSNTYHSKLGV